MIKDRTKKESAGCESGFQVRDGGIGAIAYRP